MGHAIYRLGIFSKNELAGICLAIVVRAKRGKYLFIPYGPLFKTTSFTPPNTLLASTLDALKKIAKKEQLWFIKCAPFWEINQENERMLSSCGFRRSPLHIKAETTWILDIRDDEEKLLKGMTKDHRYLIRQAQKNGVTTEQKNNLAGVDLLFQMQMDTVKRHHFVPFSKQLWYEQFQAFFPDNECFLKFSFHNGQPFSGAFIIIYQHTAFYHYGASYKLNPKIAASHVLLWECVREAKKRGCTQFNFWGIAPPDPITQKTPRQHPFAGITHFKTGFGGKLYQLLPCQDLPLSSWYWFTYMVDSIRKKLRGF